MNQPEAWITLAVGAAMALGLAGAFIPAFPDLLLIWGAGLAYGLLAGWGAWGPWLFALMSLCAVAGLIAEAWVGGLAARLGGASLAGIVAGLTLGFLGLILLGPIGAFLGLLAGTFLVEYLRRRDVSHASRATAGIGIGYGLAFVVKIGLSLAMVAAWVVWVLSA
ncbi:MAG: DUF456 domain-containing protein [Anaerolineales bacterium]